MATWQRFEDIEAWQKARRLSAAIHALTAEGKWSKDYAFVRQIRDAAFEDWLLVERQRLRRPAKSG